MQNGVKNKTKQGLHPQVFPLAVFSITLMNDIMMPIPGDMSQATDLVLICQEIVKVTFCKRPLWFYGLGPTGWLTARC